MCSDKPTYRLVGNTKHTYLFDLSCKPRPQPGQRWSGDNKNCGQPAKNSPQSWPTVRKVATQHKFGAALHSEDHRWGWAGAVSCRKRIKGDNFFVKYVIDVFTIILLNCWTKKKIQRVSCSAWLTDSVLISNAFIFCKLISCHKTKCLDFGMQQEIDFINHHRCPHANPQISLHCFCVWERKQIRLKNNWACSALKGILFFLHLRASSRERKYT